MPPRLVLAGYADSTASGSVLTVAAGTACSTGRTTTKVRSTPCLSTVSITVGAWSAPTTHSILVLGRRCRSIVAPRYVPVARRLGDGAVRVRDRERVLIRAPAGLHGSARIAPARRRRQPSSSPRFLSEGVKRQPYAAGCARLLGPIGRRFRAGLRTRGSYRLHLHALTRPRRDRRDRSPRPAALCGRSSLSHFDTRVGSVEMMSSSNPCRFSASWIAASGSGNADHRVDRARPRPPRAAAARARSWSRPRSAPGLPDRRPCAIRAWRSGPAA